MNQNSKSVQKYLLYYLLAIVIFVAVQMLFFKSPEVSQPVDTLLNAYNVNSVLTEEEALSLFSTSEITSVVEKDDFYLIKTADGNYYQTNVTEATQIGLELEGLVLTQPQVDSNPMLSFFLSLVVIMGVFFLLRFAIMVYREKNILSTVQEVAFMGVGDPEMMGVQGQGKKREKRRGNNIFEKSHF